MNQQDNTQFRGEIISKSSKRRLDLTNRKILYLLSMNARLSYSTLARMLKIKREVVAYRIKRLEEEGFLHGFFTLIDTTRFGYNMHMLYIKFFNIISEAKIKEYIHSIHEVTRVKDCAGDYDMQIVFSTKTIEELDIALDKIISKFSPNIKDYVILSMIEENFLGLGMLLSEEEKKQLKIYEKKGSSFQKEFESAKKTSTVVELDDKDKNILNILKLDARISIKDLSKKIGIAPIAVENRVKRLIKEKVILSMYPLFDISELGYQWWKVFFQVRNIKKEEFIEYLKTHDNISWYIKFIGRWNYQFSLFARDNAEFHKILNDIRTRFAESIISYDSLIILNQTKYVHRID
jgi:Lrp/AsnC family leucine-responsive transcriptional regulator